MTPNRAYRFAAALAVAGLSGCAGFVADRIVDAPREAVPIIDVPRNADDQTPMELLTAATGAATAEDGAQIHFSIVDPAERRFRSAWVPTGEPVEKSDGKNVVRILVKKFDGDAEALIGTSVTEFLAVPADAGFAPAGTAVLLHGFGMDRWQMLAWAVALAERGWRTVLVDLRGHGRSGGEYRTWGPQDGADLAAVADALEREDLRTGPLVAVGASYGGVAALHWAAQDDRIEAVVTLGAFADAAETIRAGAALFSWFGRAAPESLTTRGIARASERIDRDLLDDDVVLRAVTRITAPILIVHGLDDRLVAPDDAERLHDANDRSELWMVPEVGHVGVVVRHDLVGPIVECWLERVRSGQLDDAGHDLDCVPGDADPVAVERAP